jgi:hypothetical protein
MFLVLNLILVAFALAFSGRFDNPMVAPLFAVSAAVSTAIFWGNWRYKLYFSALFLFAIAVGCALSGKVFDSTSDRIYGIFMSTIFGCAFWQQAGPFATVNAPGWEKEKSQVDTWWQVLTAPERDKEVIEFSSGSFWTGFHTYRLVSPGPYWAVVRLWKGGTRVLAHYRIRELSAVTFMTLPTGEMKVRIGNRTIRAVNVSMPMSGDSKESALPKSA